MRYFFNILKVSFIYVGTVIGAGFASGKEIRLFFSECGIFAPVLSGILSGVFATVFLLIGRHGKGKFLHTTFFNVLICIASIISFAAMCAGSDAVYNGYGIKFGGIVTTGIILILLSFGVEKTAVFNTFLQPIIIFLIFVIFIMNTNCDFSGGFGFTNAVLYSSMNTLIAGCVMEEEGKKMSDREIYAVGILSALCMILLTTFVYCIVKNIESEMPVIAAAESCGIGFAARLIVAFAIFSTQTFSAYVIYNRFNDIIGEKFTYLLLFVLSLIGTVLGFETIVVYGYPLTSVIGFIAVVTTVAVFAKNVKEIFSSDKLRKNRLNK